MSDNNDKSMNDWSDEEVREFFVSICKRLRAEEVAEELLDRLAEVGKKNRKLREKQEEVSS